MTDYFSIAGYRELRRHHRAGRIAGARLLFANADMRLDVATEKKRRVNIQLLFSHEDEQHDREIERVLADLDFEYGGQKYRCTPSDLAALGRAYNHRQTDEDAARREGGNQFKVSLNQLRQLFRNDIWVQRNCIVAVSGSSNDGTAGVQKDSSFAAWRKEVERLAQVVFSPNAGCREFWLGKHPSNPREVIEREYGGCKPCLHGSDAHRVAKAAAPDDERYCWVKGDASFEALRQAILEPEERVHIGREAPGRHDDLMYVCRVSTSQTLWLTCGPIPLNPGLVAIIGSRGSGKTALADMLAVGAGVGSPHHVATSFLCRASKPVNLLRKGLVELKWGDGSETVRKLCPDGDGADGDPEERVQYLSQQFVEQLCSAEGLAVELRREIERVIFEATSPADRYDADSFDQLADIHLTPIRQQRASLQEAIDRTSGQILEEDALQLRVEPMEKELGQLNARIAQAKTELLSLTPKGKEERAKRLADLEAAVATAAVAVAKQKRVLVRIQDLKNEVAHIRATSFPQLLTRLKSEYGEVGVAVGDWPAFAPQFRAYPRSFTRRSEGAARGIHWPHM